LFVVGARLYKWIETLWKNRVWFLSKYLLWEKHGALLSGQPS
jgi:hypothetical protein